jgi:hypothetical protein
MASVGQDGATAIFFDENYGWAVQFRGKRSAWRREYVTGSPPDDAEQKWSIEKVAKLAAKVVPNDETFVFPFARNARHTMVGSVVVSDGKVVSVSRALWPQGELDRA